MQLNHAVLSNDGLTYMSSGAKPEWCTIPVDTKKLKNIGHLIDLSVQVDKSYIWVLPGCDYSETLQNVGDTFVTDCLNEYAVSPNELTPFLTGWKKNRKGITSHIAFPDYMKDGRFKDIKTVKELYAALTYYKVATGIDFNISYGHSFTDLMKKHNSLPERKLYLEKPTFDMSMFYDGTATEIMWCRDCFSEEELECLWLHHIDGNSSFLYMLKDAMLPVGNYKHEIRPEFNRKVPGRWNIKVYGNSVYDNKYLPRPTGNKTSGFFDTSVLQSLLLCGYTFDVVEAYIFSESHTVLRPVYNVLSNGREMLETELERFKNVQARIVALDGVKRTYANGIGLLGRPLKEGDKSYWYNRPDMRNTIVELSNNRVFWHLDQWRKKGVIVVGVHVDDIFILSNTPNIEDVIPGYMLSREIGKFKAKYTYPFKEVASYFDGLSHNLTNKLANYRRDRGTSWQDL